MLLSTPYALTCNDIKEALLKQNILTDVNEIKILAKPPHRLRDWNKQIHNFIIHEGHKPILHLEISPDLSARFNQTTEFNKAFSEHSIAPISFFREHSLDFLCHNFFNGKPINEALEKNYLPKENILKSLNLLFANLKDTETKSEHGTKDQVDELNDLFGKITSIKVLPKDVIKNFNHEVFPLLIDYLKCIKKPTCRWTNGDFIDRNLLINKDGEIVIIDTEFAQKTHFPKEDWLRFNAFSLIRKEIRKTDFIPQGQELSFYSLYFWVRQLMLEDKIRDLNLTPKLTYGILKKIADITSEIKNKKTIQVPSGLERLDSTTIFRTELEYMVQTYNDCRKHFVRNLKEIAEIKQSLIFKSLSFIKKVCTLLLFTNPNKKYKSYFDSDTYIIQEPRKKIQYSTDGEIYLSGYFADKNGNRAKKIFARIGNRNIECHNRSTKFLNDFLPTQNDIDVLLGFHTQFKIGIGLKLIRVYAETANGSNIRIGSRLIYRKKQKVHKAKRFSINHDGKINYRFVTKLKALPQIEIKEEFNQNCLKIHWIIPDYSKGAGGHMTIFRTIRFLESFGHQNTIWIMWNSQWGSASNAKKIISDHFQNLNAEVGFINENDCGKLKGDIIIATEWRSAYFVRAIERFRKRMYFVQDFEADFFPKGTEYFLAQNTLDFGFHAITAGKWLKSVLNKRGLNDVGYFELAYDSQNYFPPKNQVKESNRIAFYSRTATPRRLSEMGMLAFQILSEERNDFHVDIFGERNNGKLPFQFKSHGILDAKNLGFLYRDCTLGMVFSSTNYSLIPQEMMACGLPVIEMDGENTRKTFPRDSVILAKPDPELIAQAISNLLDDINLRNKISKNALNYVNSLSWEKSSKQVEAILKNSISKIN
jgi:glycosyltransferase involved in cell wall biosynthesis